MRKDYGELLHIYDPVFKNNIYYILSPDQKVMCQIIKKRFGITKDVHEGTDGRFLSEKWQDYPIGIIWTRNRLPQTIAHEACHATFWALEDKGVKPGFETEEVYAYMIQFIMKEIMEYLKK